MLKISAVICLICLCYADALPHCQVVKSLEGVTHRNKINVIYTMESSCKYCARKASMLPNLKASLRKAGINAHFIVAVSHKSARLSGLSSHLSINKKHLWKALGEQNNHFYIIDRCGRMVYEIINPWSSLEMPFLRGAIIATQFSHPCGLCPQDYAEVKEENLKIYPAMVEETQPLAEEIPLGIVMRLRHKHHGDSKIYNHIVMAAHGMPGHHRHLSHETNNKIKQKHTFSLNIPEGNDQAYEASSLPKEAVSESSVNKINSIKNLENHSLRMANEPKLSLESSDIKDNRIVNSASSDIKDDRIVNSVSSSIKDNATVNSEPSDTRDNPIVNSASSNKKDNSLVKTTPSDMKDNPIVNGAPSDKTDKPIVDVESSDKKDNPIVYGKPSDKKDDPIVNSTPSDTSTEIYFTENTKSSEKSQEIISSREETLEELEKSQTTTESNYEDEETSGDYYDEGSEESQSAHENSQLSNSQLVEKIALKEHYGRILDWIKYDY